MNRQFVIVTIIVAGVFGGTTALAQQRLHDLIMKDVGATFASVGRNLDANSAAEAAEDAARLEELFRETEAWWAPLNTKDALKYARFVSDAAAAVGAAASRGDIDRAKESYATIRRACTACHFTHREEIGSGYIIRP